MNPQSKSIPHLRRHGILPSLVGLVLFAMLTALPLQAAEPDGPPPANRFNPADVFELEWATDPQIAPDGNGVVYVRQSMDIMTDRVRGRLWVINADGSNHRPLTSGDHNESSPRFSPDGKRLAYLTQSEGRTQIFVRWLDTGQTAPLTNLTESPGSLVWSPDGRQLAFSMLVPDRPQSWIQLPPKPDGAKWAPEFKVIDQMLYREDGEGYLKAGYTQLFVLPSEGGTPRQVTAGKFDQKQTPVWSADGKSLIFSANRHPNHELDPLNSELYEVSLADGSIHALTRRDGPDHSPALSPDGSRLVYIGYDDLRHGYHVSQLYLANSDGSDPKPLTPKLDRSVRDPVFAADGQGVYFLYDNQGDTLVGYVPLAGGEVKTLANNVGGTTIGRPYASGSYSVANNGTVAYTVTSSQRPADVAIYGGQPAAARQLTNLNDDLLAHKQLAAVEEFWFESSHDQLKIQGWLVKPPSFNPEQRYPLILEIHGGPFANYGNRFSAEMQLYAAAGYLVVYINPRGSTGYGKEFANLIHHNYPGEDYDDLMSGVDAVLEQKFADRENLFVTGGSGGGVLSSWIVGKTDRFRAAVVAKPVINWYSFALTSDVYNFFYLYWFPGPPWEHAQHYLKRSPLSLVGNVTTPTMLMTGEQDHRTPISESEQFYQALKLRGVESVMVRVPEASHAIAARPSHLIAKAAYVLKWFEKHQNEPQPAAE